MFLLTAMGELPLGWDPWFDCPDDVRCLPDARGEWQELQEFAGNWFFQHKKESSCGWQGLGDNLELCSLFGECFKGIVVLKSMNFGGIERDFSKAYPGLKCGVEGLIEHGAGGSVEVPHF